jgi:hypothetical protein
MNRPPGEPTKITMGRGATLFCLFLGISLGLGYPVLNRYDPRQIPGLSDVQTYAALVTGASTVDAGHLRFRVLVPWVAKPFYQFAKGRSGSWDSVMFGLLVADSLFVAATALLIVVVGSRLALNRQLDGYAVSLVASLLYLLNFAVPNLRLAGLVDAGEGFFLLALLWSLSEMKLGALPVIAVLGTLTKESFVPFSMIFMATWWLVVRKQLASPVRSAIWIMASWVVGLTTITGLQCWIGGRFVSPFEFGAALHGNHDYLRHFVSSLWDRNFCYVFLWLLPLSIPHLRRFPKSWLIPTAAASVTVFVLDGYYGGAPGTVGRALFSVAGPLLSFSSASFLIKS